MEIRKDRRRSLLADDPLWFKDAIIYELHVRAFHDSDGDGVGDFRGLTEKLDYLADLGVTAIWLLPFFPSPLRDDGYDIADFTDVHPSYGTMADFRQFVREAHRRGLRVITELVLNHTSDAHPWFQRARRSPPGSRFRDFYVWNDTPEKYQDARIIFQDFESSNWTYDPVAKAYFWHRFYSHQPDLNFKSPSVRRAVAQALDLWLESGVDGLRLDAVPYLFEREGTSCENLPETHAFLKELRRRVDRKFSNRMLLAEANQWPEDAAVYFGEGDECHMAFHFPVMPRLFIALRMEDSFPVIDMLEQTPAIPENCQWAIFLRNHDELTLEMVSDEERDYMYRSYAEDPQMRVNLGIRRRLAPLLGNHRAKIELMTSLLFSLPGTPVVYYGDEIGMGDNVYLGDRNGVRTPMQWSADRNAGFSRSNPQRLYLPVNMAPESHYEAVNVEVQQQNPSSLWWWTKRLIALRKRYKAFGRGNIDFVFTGNRRVLSFLRQWEGERILVVANMSRFVQYARLDLSRCEGMRPIEMIGRTEFPIIGKEPYVLTLGPHSFFWFSIEQSHVDPAVAGAAAEEGVRVPSIVVGKPWRGVFRGASKEALENALVPYVTRSRWFRGKALALSGVSVCDVVPFSNGRSDAVVALVSVEYRDSESEIYAVPLTYTHGERADHLLREHAASVVARLVRREAGEEGIVYDALLEPGFCDDLLHAIARRRRFRGGSGSISCSPTPMLRDLMEKSRAPLTSRTLCVEQSNTSVAFGDQLIFKLLRKLDKGVNPDLEIGRFLAEKAFPNAPPLAGSIDYRRASGEFTLGVLHGYVPNKGDAWKWTRDALAAFFSAAAERADLRISISRGVKRFGVWPSQGAPEALIGAAGSYLDAVRLLGRRTAEMHEVLSSDSGRREFAPEPYGALHQRSVFQSMRNRVDKAFKLLRSKLGSLPQSVKDRADAVASKEKDIASEFRKILGRKIGGMRIRIHGDFHLGQVLFTGSDFVIMDFEGEPARALSERRIKRSPLRDLSGMVRSFHYAACTALMEHAPADPAAQAASGLTPDIAQGWYSFVSAAFLTAYRERMGQSPIIPEGEAFDLMLRLFLLEKAVYEMEYELNNRPDWLPVPLSGILGLLECE